jgi:hypothetical protein
MGSSDPVPAGFQIRFGSLNFQATRNGYLMCITNRDELHARRPTGPGPVPAAPAADASAPAQADAAGPSAPRRPRRSGQRSRQARMERRRATHVASQRDAITSMTATAPTGERAVFGPRFPLGLRGAAMAHASSANTNMAAQGPSQPPCPGGQEPYRHHRRRVLPRLHQQAATHHLARVCGVGLLRRAGSGDVPAVPRRSGLLVRLLRQLQHRELRPHAGVLCRARQ